MSTSEDFYASLYIKEDFLKHYGTPRHSGRYPWGSGQDPYQNHKGFLGYVNDLKKQGLTLTEIADGLGINDTTGKAFNSADLRNKIGIARAAIRAADIAQAEKLKATGMSTVAIGKEMKRNESAVRNLLDPGLKERNNVLQNTADYMVHQMEKTGFLDVGAGTEHYLRGISPEKRKMALYLLKEKGYKVFYLPVEQQNGLGQFTNTPVLGPPDSTFKQLLDNRDKVGTLTGHSEDGGLTITEIKKPVPISLDRVGVRYAEDGGTAMDGVIQLRRGVKDIALGEKRYAQVRINVGDTHFLKGMAMYADNMPDGVDIIFNTNKSNTGDKLDAMKKLKDDPENPFGSIVNQRFYKDDNGVEQQSVINVVSDNEEGRWNQWSRNFSSQFLSKQSVPLARRQLDESYEMLRNEYDEIVALTNPVVKKKLLEEFADGADSDAKHLKAAGLPRTRAQVILPITTLKDNEIYAPNFNNGETVALVRHPHAGTFEIPILKVNNNNREALKVLKQAEDAVGINPNVAERLSGADFDGDTVLVIPNNKGEIKSTAPLAKLKNFDTRAAYPPYDGMKTIDGGTWDAEKGEAVFPEGQKPNGKRKQVLMGEVSNLITDMTIRGANDNELARAAAHSMVVIDSEKHSLNYKQSAIDNNIAALRREYQNTARGGASTLLSLAKSEKPIDKRRPQRINEPIGVDPETGKTIYRRTVGNVDPETGKKLYTNTDEGWYTEVIDKKTGAVTQKWNSKKERVAKMDLVDDAFELSSGTTMEAVYATHANRLKKLANDARKLNYETRPDKQNKSAKQAYAPQVASLVVKLKTAEMNAPLERKAQLIAETQVRAKIEANPGMDNAEIKKLRAMEQTKARTRMGAKKTRIVFDEDEWAAVQAGAVSANMLEKMLNNADMDQVRELATPRERKTMTDAKIRLAQTMMNNGYTQSEIAQRLGVSVSAIHNALSE